MAQVPFETTVLGATVTVERVDFNEADEIVAVCRRDRECQRIRSWIFRSPRATPGGRVDRRMSTLEARWVARHAGLSAATTTSFEDMSHHPYSEE